MIILYENIVINQNWNNTKFGSKYMKQTGWH